MDTPTRRKLAAALSVLSGRWHEGNTCPGQYAQLGCPASASWAAVQVAAENVIYFLLTDLDDEE